MTEARTFGRQRRIRRKPEFDRAFQRGRRVTVGHFVFVFFARTSAEEAEAPARLGLVVSRKAGNAVVRNRIKRLAREAFRRSPERLPPGVDIVLIPRVGAHDLAFSAVDAEFEEAFSRIRKLLAKAPLLTHVPGPTSPSAPIAALSPRAKRETREKPASRAPRRPRSDS